MPSDVLDYLNTGGVVALLLLIIITGWREDWVWGAFYRRKERECNAWRDLAMKNLTTASEAITLAEEGE